MLRTWTRFVPIKRRYVGRNESFVVPRVILLQAEQRVREEAERRQLEEDRRRLEEEEQKKLQVILAANLEGLFDLCLRNSLTFVRRSDRLSPRNRRRAKQRSFKSPSDYRRLNRFVAVSDELNRRNTCSSSLGAMTMSLITSSCSGAILASAINTNRSGLKPSVM